VLHHSTTHKRFLRTFPDFTRTSQLSSPLDLDRQQHLGLVLIPYERHFFKVLLSAETEATVHVAKCGRDALEHPVLSLSPDYVSANIKELVGGRRSIPFSLPLSHLTPP